MGFPYVTAQLHSEVL